MANGRLRRAARFHGDAIMSGGKTGIALAGTVSLLLGGSVGALTAWLANVSWMIAALVAMATLLFFYAWGAYRVWDKADEKRQEAESGLKDVRDELEAARSALASAPPSVKFVENMGSISGSEITNTYNGPAGLAPGTGTPGGALLKINPGSGIGKSVVTIESGNGEPAPFPNPLPSTPDERARLCDQLVALAGQVDAVMGPWGASTLDVARQMDIPGDEFMARLPEIQAEHSRIGDEITARYNRECRSAVIWVYGQARSIGLADAEMERLWQTRLGAGAAGIPPLLRRIASRIQN